MRHDDASSSLRTEVRRGYFNVRSMSGYDAVVVGAGPNGLAAAIVLARAGQRVLLIEARETIGGGARTAPLTLPGYLHDVCSAVHPLARASSFFRELSLESDGLEWCEPDVELAHPLDDGSAGFVTRNMHETARHMGSDSRAWTTLLEPLVAHFDAIIGQVLFPFQWPKRPWSFLRFGLRALRSARGIVNSWFSGEHARALFAGAAAHSFLPLEAFNTGGFGLLLLSSAHAVGWPVARGGSQTIADALAARFIALGGEIRTSHEVASLSDLPESRVVLFDVTPAQLLRIAGQRFSRFDRWRLSRFRYGPGVFKMDFALNAPIPWRADACRRATTVHVGGSFDEIASAEPDVNRGISPERPFVLVAQPTIVDPSRAPEGAHVAWAYCHVAHGSPVDMQARIEAQIERFAPGFRDCIGARVARTPADVERYNPNCIGGDINGGSADGLQLVARPWLKACPYSTSDPRIFICSSSTPPGGGVHGMCGYLAARAALRALTR